MNGDMTMDAPSVVRRRRWILLLVGMAAGGAFGWGIGLGLKKTPILQAPWEDFVALLIGVTLLPGVAIGVASLFRRGSTFIADPYGRSGGRTDPIRGEPLYQRLSAATSALAGAMLVTPVLMRAAPGGGSAALRETVMLGLVVAFAVQTLVNLAVWRRSDEFFRRLIADSAALCFWVLQGALFLWAAAEKLSLVPSLTAWQATVVMMAGYLIASYAVYLRRGIR